MLRLGGRIGEGTLAFGWGGGTICLAVLKRNLIFGDGRCVVGDSDPLLGLCGFRNVGGGEVGPSICIGVSLLCLRLWLRFGCCDAAKECVGWRAAICA